MTKTTAKTRTIRIYPDPSMPGLSWSEGDPAGYESGPYGPDTLDLDTLWAIIWPLNDVDAFYDANGGGGGSITVTAPTSHAIFDEAR